MWVVFFCILFWDKPISAQTEMQQYNLYKYCDSVTVETRKELREIKRNKRIKITKIKRHE